MNGFKTCDPDRRPGNILPLLIVCTQGKDHQRLVRASMRFNDLLLYLQAVSRHELMHHHVLVTLPYIPSNRASTRFDRRSDPTANQKISPIIITGQNSYPDVPEGHRSYWVSARLVPYSDDMILYFAGNLVEWTFIKWQHRRLLIVPTVCPRSGAILFERLPVIGSHGHAIP